MSTPLEQAVAYIKAGDTEKGKQLLAEALKQNPRDENAWLWMTRCVKSTEEKRYCFDRVLKINPQNQHAIEGMRRLNNPAPPNLSPIAQYKPQVNQQKPAPQSKPKKSNLLRIILAAIGLVGFVCVCGMALLVYNSINSGNSNQQNNSAPTQKARPNYRRMLETDGFVYRTNDSDGDPIYVSPCGCLVTVKPDYMGFGVYYDPDNDCPMQDLGAIITVMYPSEVFDFILSNMDSAIVEDTIIQGTAAGHNISMDFDRVDYKLIIVIKDPR